MVMFDVFKYGFWCFSIESVFLKAFYVYIVSRGTIGVLSSE